MNKAMRRIIIAVGLAVLLVVNMSVAYADDASKTGNRYNIVFVTDESGSMKHSDPEDLRYEAIRRFTGLMAQEGNYLGSVSFDDQIQNQQDVTAVSGFSQKNAFVQTISSVTSDGNTNIGMGLSAAIDSLNTHGNSDLPSAIILLTDGNTRMDTDEEEQESLELKADAIEQARRAGYAIYTICLNVDGSADTSEMQQIATATGGEFTEVSDPADLADVETVYYKMIFGGYGSDENDEEVIITENGAATKTFEVPAVGVEEFNVIFEGEFTKCEISDPNQYTYSETELQEISMAGKNFNLVKITDPVGGAWTATVYGNSGAAIHIKLLYNTDFSIQTAISQEEGYHIGDVLSFEAQVCDADGVVSDLSEYQGFSGTLHIDNNGTEETYDMALGESGFTYDYEIPDEGTYYASITVSNEKMSADSDEQYEISVNNTAPVPPEKEPQTHIFRWPFIGGTAEIDLNGTVSDSDGDALTYTVESTAFNAEDYALEDGVLKVENFSVSKGSFTIRATDTHGAYCTYDVLISSTNIGLVMAIVIVIGGLIVLLVIGLLIYKKKGIPFMGEITVERFDDESEETFRPVSQEPGRGSIRLESFVYNAGLPAGSKFQAGGRKKEIYFVSKKPVYSDITGGTSKRIVIDGSGSEVRISADPELSSGIIVTFKSLLYNPF